MLFTHEHAELRRTVERFCREELNPHVDAWEDAGAFPAHEVFRKLGQLGLLGLTKPEAAGGAALDYSYAVVLAEALGACTCGGVPLAIGVQTDMATPALARIGSTVSENLLEVLAKRLADTSDSDPRKQSISEVRTPEWKAQEEKRRAAAARAYSR